MPAQGKAEVILKISQYPDEVKTVQNGWKEFDVESNGRLFRITIKPKIFSKLDDSKDVAFLGAELALNGDDELRKLLRVIELAKDFGLDSDAEQAPVALDIELFPSVLYRLYLVGVLADF